MPSLLKVVEVPEVSLLINLKVVGLRNPRDLSPQLFALFVVDDAACALDDAVFVAADALQDFAHLG